MKSDRTIPSQMRGAIAAGEPLLFEQGGPGKSGVTLPASRVPDSLYRIALIQIEMDDMDEAEQTLQRIVNTYPETITAELAGDKLDEIR